jgi:hypothetical protein
MRKSAAMATAVAGLAATWLISSRLLAGGIPATGALAYRGVLESEDGALIAGEHDLAIELWTAPEAGERACATETERHDVAAGQFSIALPDDCTAAVGNQPDLWIAVVVDGSALPRTKIGAVPYSVEAGNAAHAGVAEQARAASGPLEQRIAMLESRLATLESAPLPGVRGEWVAGAPVNLAPQAPVTASLLAFAQCPAGKRPIAGGCHTQHGAYALWGSLPNGDRWDCRASPTRTTGTDPLGPFLAWAFCAE